MQQTFSSQTQESLCLQYYMVNGNNQWQQCTVYNSFCYTIWSIVYAKHERMIFFYVTHPSCIQNSILLLILAVNSNICNIQLISRLVYMLGHETIIVPYIAHNIFIKNYNMYLCVLEQVFPIHINWKPYVHLNWKVVDII